MADMMTAAQIAIGEELDDLLRAWGTICQPRSEGETDHSFRGRIVDALRDTMTSNEALRATVRAFDRGFRGDQ